MYLALENDLEIIPILNKIDLPAADPDRVTEEIEDTIGLDCSNIGKCLLLLLYIQSMQVIILLLFFLSHQTVRASAKSGIGIDDILESIVKYVPPPKPDTGGPFRALIFDSLFDAYRGVIVFFRVVDGAVKKGDKVRFLASKAEHDVTEVGIMQPNQVPVDCLRAGEVGYICGSIKDVLDARVGDTITLSSEYKAAAKELDPKDGEDPITPLPGYSESIPMVFCGVFPVDADQYENLRDALGVSEILLCARFAFI